MCGCLEFEWSFLFVDVYRKYVENWPFFGRYSQIVNKIIRKNRCSLFSITIKLCVNIKLWLLWTKKNLKKKIRENENTNQNVYFVLRFYLLDWRFASAFFHLVHQSAYFLFPLMMRGSIPLFNNKKILHMNSELNFAAFSVKAEKWLQTNGHEKKVETLDYKKSVQVKNK